ncbi:hypothetical protein [Microvirga guangxiensis]|uniref:Uncharacterized protein n=1 Tax=Microvirga guangxiensis TaxID=549386 RepID=A0A1G5LG39_9HYPH|nr:hypothetical protein [Microvirga guangxiensis]SCZ11268.1 hypothetical protein SAMN02927923_04225 [Microvirga guangxiensis]
MPQTTVATGTFPSRKAANQAVQRLVSSGFARNSIELHQHEDDDGYDLEIHTRRENVGRAQRLIYASSSGAGMSMHGIGNIASGAVYSAKSHPLVLLGAGLLAGFVLYNLIPRSSEQEHTSRQQTGRSGRHNRR